LVSWRFARKKALTRQKFSGRGSPQRGCRPNPSSEVRDRRQAVIHAKFEWSESSYIGRENMTQTTIRVGMGVLVGLAIAGFARADEASAVKAIKALGGKVPGANVVNLERTKIMDQDLKSLLEFKEVAFLRLVDTPITDAGMATIGRLKKLKVLELAGTRITDTGLQQVAGLTDLEQLDLNRTRVTDAGIRNVKNLKKLRHLHVTGAPVTDAAMKDVHELANLEQLTLDRTLITDSGLKELRGLNKLEGLSLVGTSVSDAGIRLLKDPKDFARLRYVVVIETRVTAAGREELRKSHDGKMEVSPRP